MTTATPVRDTRKAPEPLVRAPVQSYWIYTEKGSRLHQARPGTVVKDNPYSVPESWVTEGHVEPEELE
ncbi:hypothetical protein [Metabacillus sp. SLBN-84]